MSEAQAEHSTPGGVSDLDISDLPILSASGAKAPLQHLLVNASFFVVH